MRIRMLAAVLTSAGLLALPAAAQEGRYAPQLTQIIEELATGKCLAALMAPPVLDVCNGLVQGMAPALAALGTVKSLTFLSAQDTPDGRVETYRVEFGGGETLDWFIGKERNGKFSSVGTAG